MCSKYKLRQCIDAHDNDVRSLCVLPKINGFLSASRDLSVRLWTEENKNFKENHQYNFHKNYISVVYYMESSVDFPEGVIFSSGYDKVIKGFFPNSVTVQFTLIGHKDTVNSIKSTDTGDILSGSMDGTAILWDLSTSSIKQIYKGHERGIWSLVVLKCMSRHFITASADNEIFLWNIEKKDSLKKYSGHTDCVRDLLEIPSNNQFLSCSNDSTIRLWSLRTVSCIGVFQGHTSFIYCLAGISDNRFVSCGEEGIISVWSLNSISSAIQTIDVKVQSVWCVSVLRNGDIIIGSSDGTIRIFSEDASLQNAVEIKSKINKSVRDESLINNLPVMGIEALSLPGQYDKQLLKINDENHEILYEWSAKQQIWIKIKMLLGDQSDTVSEKLSTGNHDYVFSIDIKDGEPPIKLFYKKGEDPWIVAKRFLDDNDLSPMFLDQVANFIINNVPQETTATSSSQPIYSDPFTGSNRYVPFPNVNDQVSSPDTHSRQFPHLNYIRYDQINSQGLLKKVDEIMGAESLSNEVRMSIENIQQLSASNAACLCRWLLDGLDYWPKDQLFPCIDMLRMVVRDNTCNILCFSDLEWLGTLLLKVMNGTSGQLSKPNVLTTIKLIVNAFSHLAGENAVFAKHIQISDFLTGIVHSFSDKNILIAVSSWLLNISVYINNHHDEAHRIEAFELCYSFIKEFERHACPEAIHRTLVAIGTLVCCDDSFTFRDSLTMDVFQKFSTLSRTFTDTDKWGEQVRTCCQQLTTLASTLDILHF